MSRSSSTAENVLDVLLLFDETRPELTADEISKLVGTPRSTTYRYIRTLREKGFLEPTANDGWRLGPRLMQFTRIVRRREDVGTIALPYMEQLCQQVRETVLLTRLSAPYAVCIERVEAPHAMRITFERGHLQPLHAGASSKILLAFLPPDEVDKHLALPLERYTENTVTDTRLLKEQLREIRKQGYCISDSEVDAGAIAVAVPILDDRGKLLAGLSTAGPTFRMDDNTVAQHITHLRATAATIQEKLASSL